MVDEYETKGARLVAEGDLLRVLMHPETDQTADHIMEMHDVLREQIGRKMLVLIDARRVKSMTRGAREVSAGDHLVDWVTRLAVLVDSSFSVVLSNFIIRVQRPRYPVRMFRDESAALVWLNLPPDD